jgi:hypothetical protein
MVSLGIISIPEKYNVLNYAVGPVGNEDLFMQAWTGIKRTWNAFYGAVADLPNIDGAPRSQSSHFRVP